MNPNAAEGFARAPAVPEPTYRLDRSFEWNAANGPAFAGPLPDIPATPLKPFFGLPVHSRFGLAASLVLNARWFDLYGRLGFDLLTYKTVRRQARQAHPVPNWLFLDERSLPTLADDRAALTASQDVPDRPLMATAAGSIGMPSSGPDFWVADIRRCRAMLGSGQALIVSVVGTAGPDSSADAFLAEFEELAGMVATAGAQLVEANLSCPNVERREGETYRDAEMAGRIAAAVRRGAGGRPVLVKIGPVDDASELRALLQALSGHADGVVMINAPSRRIVDGSGRPAFGSDRPRGGVMGSAIFPLALQQVRTAVEIIARDGLGIEVIAVGGIISVERVRAALDAGAYAALAASAAAWNPRLAAEVKRIDPTI